MRYCVIYTVTSRDSRSMSQSSGKGALRSSRCMGSWAIFRYRIGINTPQAAPHRLRSSVRLEVLRGVQVVKLS